MPNDFDLGLEIQEYPERQDVQAHMDSKECCDECYCYKMSYCYHCGADCYYCGEDLIHKMRS